MIYGVTDLPTFILGTLFIVLLPGPNSLYVMTVASRHGRAAGYGGAAGIFVGDAVLMTLAATGVASLFQTHPALFLALKYAGAGYLAWLGWGLLRAARVRWLGATENPPVVPAVATPAGPPTRARPGRAFRVALAISLANPKAILFYVSFFIQFVAPGYEHPALSFLILGTVVQVLSMLYLTALILGGHYLAALLRRRQRLSAVATGGVGGLFIGFGVKLAGASLA